MDLQWLDDGVYHWCKWKPEDTDSYDYHIRVAANGRSLFNMFNSLPNVGDTKGGEKVAVLNGGIFYNYEGGYDNIGPEVCWYYNENQSLFVGYPSDYLIMGTWGSSFSFGTRNDGIYGNYPCVLGGPSTSSGGGEDGVKSTRAHSFIGKGSDGTCYMGYCRYSSDAQNSGQTGANIVSTMTGKYGGTCMVLDGGGSTQMQYKGATKTSGDGRKIKNAIVLYRVKKAVKQFIISTSVSPSGTGSVSGAGTYDSGTSVTLIASANSGYRFIKWSDNDASNPKSIVVSADASYAAVFEKIPDYIDNDRLGEVAGKSYVLNGLLKKANNWYTLRNNVLLSKPSIYTLQNGSLKPLILKYLVKYNLNGGAGDLNTSYYFGDTTSLQAPTHNDYEGVACKFEGWFKESSFSNKIVSLGQNATGDRNLYAKWSQTKTQYKGTYIVSGESQTVNLNGKYGHGYNPALYHGTLIWSSSLGYLASEDTKISKIFVNTDYYDDSYNYKKPAVYYGYCTADDKFTNIGQLYENGNQYPEPVSVDYTIPAGHYFAIMTVQDEGRNHGYMNDGGYIIIDGSKSYEVDWQDSANPPQGKWADGSPQTRSTTRWYDGSNWTDWKEG